MALVLAVRVVLLVLLVVLVVLVVLVALVALVALVVLVLLVLLVLLMLLVLLVLLVFLSQRSIFEKHWLSPVVVCASWTRAFGRSLWMPSPPVTCPTAAASAPRTGPPQRRYPPLRQQAPSPWTPYCRMGARTGVWVSDSYCVSAGRCCEAPPLCVSTRRLRR